MKPIITQSKYGAKRTIECVDSDRGIFKMYGKSYFTREGEGMFDFEGGPMLMVGEDFYGLGTIAALYSKWEMIDEGVDTENLVYVSVDLNKKTIRALRKEKEKYDHITL